MIDEPSNAVLAERLDHVIRDIAEVKYNVGLLMSAYQQAKGAKWMLSLLKGSGLIAIGTGLVKGIEWISQMGGPPPYHP